MRAMLLPLVLFVSLAIPSFANVGLLDRQGTTLNLNELRFTNEQGATVPLASFFHAATPTVVALVYYGCPGVCTQVLSGMFEGLRNTQLIPGKAFEAVIVSIAPAETSGLAAGKKSAYLSRYGFEASSAGFHFLVGTQSQISQLAGALGFEYEKMESGVDFRHPAALFVLSPKGQLVKTLSGVRFTARGLRAVIASAAGGKSLGAFERMKLYCLENTSSLSSYLLTLLRKLQPARLCPLWIDTERLIR